MTVPNVIDPKANHSTFFEARIERYGLASISVGEFLRGMRGAGSCARRLAHWWIHHVFSTVTGEFFFIQLPVIVRMSFVYLHWIAT